jgi:transcriptional adapter 3
MRGKGKGRTADKASSGRGAGKGVSKNSNAKRSVSPPFTPSPEWPYDKYYSDMFSTIADASNEGGAELPEMGLLKRLQQDLATLVASANQRVSVCDARITKLKRVDTLVNEERKKREKGGRTSADAENSTTVFEDEQGDVIMGDSGTVDSVVKTEDSVQDMTSMQAEFRRHSPDEHEKNPKSEFVESQVLPVAALNLFEHSIAGLPQTGEEYLKKKYGVASYPTTTLKDMLPGEIPDQDFSKAKPPNQVQFTSFAQYIEPFFRSYTEEDISFLNQKAVGGDTAYTRPGLISPSVIPPLGPSYVDVWAREDGPNPGYSLTPLSSRTDTSRLRPKGSSDNLTDDSVEAGNEVSCGPLASRLLSAIMEDPEQNTAGEPNDKESSIIDSSWKVNAVPGDYTSLEERLKREFRYVGILDVNLLKSEEKKKQQFRLASNGAKVNGGNTANASTLDDDFDIDWVNGREDDEICYELRMLQKKLRTVTKVNQACKRRLTPLVQEQMAYQEYTQILDDLDRQVDQAYVKKIRNPKSKKKKSSSTLSGSNASGTISVDQKPGMKPLLDKRQRWIDKIGPVFNPSEIMKRVPSESIFKDLQIDEDDEDYPQNEEDETLYGVNV